MIDESPGANSWQARSGPLNPSGGSLGVSTTLIVVIVTLAAEQNLFEIVNSIRRQIVMEGNPFPLSDFAEENT